MSSSDIKIVITASDQASKKFDDLVTSAEKLGPALDDAASGADKIKPAADDAVSSLGPLPGKIDDLTKSASDAKQPLADAGDSTKDLGSAISDAGTKIPGAAGDIVSSFGDLVSASKDVESSSDGAALKMSALKGIAVGVAAVFGPIAMGAALTIGAAAISKLSGLLSGGDSLADHLEETRASAAKLNTEILNMATGMDNAAQGLAVFAGGRQLDERIQDFTKLIELQKVFQGGNPAGDFAGGAVEGINTYNEAVALAIDLTGKYGISTSDLMNGQVDLTGTLQTLTEAQGKYKELLDLTGPGADAVRERLVELATQYKNGEISADELNKQLTWMNDNLETAYIAPALAAEAMRQMAKAAYDAAVAVGLLNTDVEKLAASGTHTAAIDLAVNFDQSALENTFNVVVGGSNRLGQSAQAVADWSAGLNDASDGMSKLQRVTDKNLITQDDYNAAVESNTKIQAANARIQDDIVAIQAKQAPLLAELTEQQAEYLDSLSQLPAEQQLAALGFMDAAESAKAMQLAYLAADAASGNLGDTGTATATKIIEAAAQADPVMKQMLLDMGLISEGADGTITVNFPTAESITEAVDKLSANIADLTTAIENIPDFHNTDITASDSASGTIEQIRQQLDGLDGTTATVYISPVVTGTVPANGSSLIGGGRDGGVMGMANGGMVTVELGEAGQELLTFRNGGQALVPMRGIYSVPVGTHVLPAPATAATLRERGSGDVYMDMRGATIVIEADSADVADSFRQWAISQDRLN